MNDRITKLYEGMKASLKRLSERINPPPDGEMKLEGTDGVADWAKQLYEESMSDRDAVFSQTKQMRSIREHVGTPESYLKACELLEASNDWEVFGHRNVNLPDQWKQERVDGEIQRQMRARTNYLTSAWHDIEVMPNIQNISDIFDQEREKIDWGNFTKRYVKTAQTYGESVAKIFFDRTVEGTAFSVICCEGGSVLRSPLSRSMKKKDGCWYVVHADTITNKEVEEQYDELDISTLAIKGENRDKTQARQYANTKSYQRLEIWMDDTRLVPIEFTDEDQAKIIDDNQAMMQGQKVEAQPDEHHVQHIMQKTEAMDNMMSVEPETDEDKARLLQMLEAYHENVSQHLDMALEDDHTPAGYKPYYPYGRKITVVGGKVAEDQPNPYQIPWRKLFRELKNEDVVGRVDGRGDPEILYNEEKMLSTQLSRIEDLILVSGFPKKVRHIDDKVLESIDQDDNDPTRTLYYKTHPPTFIKSEPPQAAFELYKMRKESIQQSLGVNEVTFGQAPTANSSAELANTLLQQNEQTITGELNQNLTDAIKDIVESLLSLYKIFYTEERQYFIDGELKKLRVSEILSYTTVNVQGQMQQVPIEKFEISVKPNSNYPNRWEKEMSTLLQFTSLQYADGTPVVPMEFVRDVLSEKYPQLGKNGEYATYSKATQIGLQILAQQQQEQQLAEQARGDQLKASSKEFIQRNMKSFTPTNGENGNGQANNQP